MDQRKPITKYIPSLDGLRAFAVSIVVISHAGLDHIVPGGFGVTIFFFLSGYLITTLLRLEWEKNNGISLKGFYLRRVYRIFPPLYIVLALSLLLVVLGVIGRDKPVNVSSIVAQILFATNYYAITVGEHNFLPGTAVLWSLAIEEHFYFIFPVALLMMLRRFSYRHIVYILICICLIVLLWRYVLVLLYDVDSQYVYMASDTRIDSLLWGCMLGLMFNPHLDSIEPVRGIGSKIAVFLMACAILLFCFLYRNETFRETARYTLQGMALWPIFWLSVRHHNWILFRPLNWWAVRWLGRISYTLYLSHLIGYSVASLFISEKILQSILGVVISVVFSLAMYFLVEQRFMSLRKQLHKSIHT